MVKFGKKQALIEIEHLLIQKIEDLVKKSRHPSSVLASFQKSCIPPER